MTARECVKNGRRALEAAGPAFIKWGQWAATRHDMFPPDMCTELEHLHTQVSCPTPSGTCMRDCNVSSPANQILLFLG